MMESYIACQHPGDTTTSSRKSAWRNRKVAFWLLGIDPVPLKWGRGAPPEAWVSTDRPRAVLAAEGIAQLSKKEAKATPLAFRDLLLSLARSTAHAKAA
jgi:hypothetical protein